LVARVAGIRRIRHDLERLARDHIDAVLAQRFDLARIVGQEPDPGIAQIAEDLGRHAG